LSDVVVVDVVVVVVVTLQSQKKVSQMSTENCFAELQLPKTTRRFVHDKVRRQIPLLFLLLAAFKFEEKMTQNWGR